MAKTLQGHHLFAAILPSPDAARRIGEMRNVLGGKSPVADERLHITMGLLPLLEEIDRGIESAACSALSAVRCAPVRVCFDRILTRSGHTGLIPSETLPALIDLQRKIDRSFLNAGLPFAPLWSFNPHITLLYSGVAAPLEHVDVISWRVDEIVLVHSYVGLSRHEILHRVPLVDVAA